MGAGSLVARCSLSVHLDHVCRKEPRRVRAGRGKVAPLQTLVQEGVGVCRVGSRCTDLEVIRVDT